MRRFIRFLAGLILSIFLAIPNSYAKGGGGRSGGQAHGSGSHGKMSGSFSSHGKSSSTHVKGYYRKSGTYVKPYNRTTPDKSKSNNWSSKGNINPYTGEEGTKDPIK